MSSIKAQTAIPMGRDLKHSNQDLMAISPWLFCDSIQDTINCNRGAKKILLLCKREKKNKACKIDFGFLSILAFNFIISI